MPQKLAPIFVVPLYLGSDEGVKKHFFEHKEEIGQITGSSIVVHLAESVQQGDAQDVAKAINSSRYPGLKASDLPCLWVEKDGAHFVLRLSDDLGSVKRTIRALVDEVLEAGTFEELEEKMTERQNQAPETSAAKTPAWFPIAGFVSGVVTLLFFMGLVLVSMLWDKTVPQGGKWAATVVLSLGVGLASSFLGGSARASGKLKIPFMKDNPVGFAIVGGGAMTLIFILIGYYTYVRA